MTNPIMGYFAYSHLPEHLQKVSKPVGELAQLMDAMLPDGPEKSAGLRKLLEAKDCLVRASIGATLNEVSPRTILHVTVGNSGWEPTAEEIDEVTRMFLEAKHDPIGGIITTRYGVSADVVSISENSELRVVSANVDNAISLTGELTIPGILSKFHADLSKVVEIVSDVSSIALTESPVFNSQFFRDEEAAKIYFEKFVAAVSSFGVIYLRSLELNEVENGLMLQMSLYGVPEHVIQGIC